MESNIQRLIASLKPDEHKEPIIIKEPMKDKGEAKIKLNIPKNQNGKLVPAPLNGVYLLQGYRSNSKTGYEHVILYIGKSSNVWGRVNNHLKYYGPESTRNSNFRDRLEKLGFGFCFSQKDYESPIGDRAGEVFIKEVVIYPFDSTSSGNLGRDLLEILLIHEHEPYFNRQFSNLTTEEREKIDGEEETETFHPVIVSEAEARDTKLDLIGNLEDIFSED